MFWGGIDLRDGLPAPTGAITSSFGPRAPLNLRRRSGAISDAVVSPLRNSHKLAT